jgi:fumarate reductase flavoprotein subunit
MYLQPTAADLTTEVVVIGTGPGGLSAVGSAIAHGAQVVAIESHDNIGGNGLLSTGWVAFVDSALQRSLGIRDSVDLFMKDCKRLLDQTHHLYGLTWDQELTRFYAEQSSKMYDELMSRGVKFTRLIKRPLQTSVDRLAAVGDTKMFPAAFERDFSGPNCKTFLCCSAQRLLTDSAGAVIGVIVQPRDNQPSFTVYARKGVILAAGGYGANLALRRHFQPDTSDVTIYSGLHTCRGDGQLIGQAVGGDLINMTMIPPIVAVPSHLTEEAIAVNLSGHRFHDEAGPYYDRVYALRQQPQKTGHYIFDSETYAAKTRYVDPMAGPLTQAPTLASLAQKLGISAAAVESSVGKWNDFLTSGAATDPATGRVQFAPSRRPIAQAPFYSKRMVEGVSLTCGGFVTTISMQVVDVWGKAIPGLFAVGDCAGGLTPTAEMGGTHLGGGFVLGWEAGRAAAKGEYTEPHTAAVFGQAVEKNKGVDMSMPIISVDVQQQTGSKL